MLDKDKFSDIIKDPPSLKKTNSIKVTLYQTDIFQQEIHERKNNIPKDLSSFPNYNARFSKSKDRINTKPGKNKTVKQINSKKKTKKCYNDFNLKNKSFLIIFIFFILQNISIEFNPRMLHSHSSNITIKFKETGIQKIFYEGTSCNGALFPRPKEVYINNQKQSEVKEKYDITEPMSEIKLLWYNTISNCNCLFKECTKIIDIDFSQFSFSSGLNANQMFANCESLTSLDFKKYGSIKLYSAYGMFQNCYSLKFLDITTLEVTSISDFAYMFNGCRSLISLDLNNFSGGHFLYGQYMFYDCPSLEYVYFGNAHFCYDYNNLNNFLKAAKNVVFCNGCCDITPKVSKYNGCAVNYCGSDWRTRQYKIDLSNQQCVRDCSTTSNNKYLYGSKCYTICPEGTYTNNLICEDCHSDCKKCENPPTLDNTNCQACLEPKFLKYGNCVTNCLNGYYLDENDNTNKICKCDLNKCFKCSQESFELNLCITCNDGYYPKYQDSNNINSFIDCYQSIEGYYLDNNNNNPILKPCYESCKTCQINGNNNIHNCVLCKSDYYFELNKNKYKNCYKMCINYHYHDKSTNTYFCTENLQCPDAYNKLILEKKECINECYEDEIYKYEFKKRCHVECPKDTNEINYFCQLNCTEERPFELVSLQECIESCSIKDYIEGECILNFKSENETKINDIILRNIDKGFISNEYDTTKLENGQDELIEFGKIIITLTTALNQKHNIYINNTVIDLKE